MVKYRYIKLVYSGYPRDVGVLYKIFSSFMHLFSFILIYTCMSDSLNFRTFLVIEKLILIKNVKYIP